MNSGILSKNVKNNILYLAASEEEKELLDRIINAIEIIDRQFFVKNKNDAYIDTALPIGYNQTISQPSTVARMLMLANPESGNNLLELGSGSGWNASLAGYIVYPGKVTSMDIIPELISDARKNLDELKSHLNFKDRKKLTCIQFKNYNILKNLSHWQDKYNRVIITAGITQQQESLIYQLADKTLTENGILVCPHSQGPLIILKRKNGKITKNTTMENYVFVPLIG
jgi:protein-L-isoaspartate(D-aspartate) O-methyltransferase